jgi:hypothetical protein
MTVVNGNTPPVMGIKRRDGKYLAPVECTTGLPDDLREALIECLEYYARTHGFKMTLTAYQLIP